MKNYFESIENKTKRIFGSNYKSFNLENTRQCQKLVAGDNIKKGDKVEIIGSKVVPVITAERKNEIIKTCLQYAMHRSRRLVSVRIVFMGYI